MDAQLNTKLQDSRICRHVYALRYVVPTGMQFASLPFDGPMRIGINSSVYSDSDTGVCGSALGWSVRPSDVSQVDSMYRSASTDAEANGRTRNIMLGHGFAFKYLG